MQNEQHKKNKQLPSNIKIYKKLELPTLKMNMKMKMKI